LIPGSRRPDPLLNLELFFAQRSASSFEECLHLGFHVGRLLYIDPFLGRFGDWIGHRGFDIRHMPLVSLKLFEDIPRGVNPDSFFGAMSGLGGAEERVSAESLFVQAFL